MRLRSVSALSLVFTYLFFFEYLPPARWVDIPYDLQYYHYPLDDFAFRSIQAGHIPEWDPTIYCGMSFAGNPQTALFYPPMWLTFAANLGRLRLGYRSLEILVIGHCWLAFLFSFLWLRHRKLKELACVLGAGVFAYSGYMLLQLQHLGLVCGYTWMPIGLWSIDQALASRSWRPLWKLACASALCFLAGYPPMSVVFSVCMLTYAAFGAMRWKAILWTAGALAFSFLIAMVQLLPTWEALSLKTVIPGYGGGVPRRDFYLSYLIPNYFDFWLHTPPNTNLFGEYLYLGAPAFFGLLWLASHRKAFQGQLPILAVGLVSLIFVNNPFGLIWNAIKYSDLLVQIFRSWYFLAGITLSVAGLAAAGLDRFLRREVRPPPRWMTPLVIVLFGAWSARLLWIWKAGSAGFASGWRGAIDPAVMLALFSLAIVAVRGEKGKRLACVTVALLIATGVDYKAFGTSKRVNAFEGNMDRILGSAPFPGMDDDVYRQLRKHSEYRIALDAVDPVPNDLRHYGLTTPQGGDPMVPAQYLEVASPMEKSGIIALDPANQDLMQLLGVRYFLTTEDQPLFSRLKADPDYRPLGPPAYIRVFEFSKAKLPYRSEKGGPGDSIQRTGSRNEQHDFLVHSESGGRFILIEQFFAGWHAAVDDKEVAIERWNRAFQSITVPPGDHRVSFAFRSRGLRIGAIISVVSLLLLIPLVMPARSSTC
ncbi:MAG TPA: YfhO family protein [Bryobacteraceae bacterium]